MTETCFQYFLVICGIIVVGFGYALIWAGCKIGQEPPATTAGQGGSGKFTVTSTGKPGAGGGTGGGIDHGKPIVFKADPAIFKGDILFHKGNPGVIGGVEAAPPVQDFDAGPPKRGTSSPAAKTPNGGWYYDESGKRVVWEYKE